MFWLAALSAIVAAPQQPASAGGTRPAVQAIATVRIVSGAQLRFAAQEPTEGARLRAATIRTPQGTEQARLYEFE